MADFTLPRITEKRYFKIIPQPFTADATNQGLITIASTYSFKVGQLVIVKSTTQPDLKVKVQTVISETQFIVIEINEAVTTKKKLDMSAYLLADTATVEFLEDKRPVIDLHEIQRQVYEEEPTVALRTHSVDWLGRPYDKTNPLQVQLSDGSINIGTVNAELETQLSHKDNTPDSGDVADSVQIGDGKDILAINDDGSINVVTSGGSTNTPTIANVIITLANTEYSYAFPTGTKQFTIKDREGNAKTNIAYTSGNSGTLFETIGMGVKHEVNSLSTLVGFTVYFQSSKANRTLEIVSWK